jgi:hypothetical protein
MTILEEHIVSVHMYSQTPEYNTAFRRRSQLGIQKKGIGGFLIPDCRQRKTDKTTTKRKWIKRRLTP